MLHSKSVNEIRAGNGRNIAEMIQKTKEKHLGLSQNVKKVYFTPELIGK